MEIYHYQISIIGQRTPWANIIHRSRRFKSYNRAVELAIRAASYYNAEVRLSTGKHPLESNGLYVRSPFIK